MTQDDIIFMARASGWMSEYESSTGFSAEAAFKFASLVASAEREACAQFIEHEYVRQFERPWRVDLSAAIRARK